MQGWMKKKKKVAETAIFADGKKKKFFCSNCIFLQKFKAR